MCIPAGEKRMKTHPRKKTNSKDLFSFTFIQFLDNRGCNFLYRRSGVVVPELFKNIQTLLDILLAQGGGAVHGLAPGHGVVDPAIVDHGEVITVASDVIEQLSIRLQG